jgi:hypothetical protein
MARQSMASCGHEELWDSTDLNTEAEKSAMLVAVPSNIDRRCRRLSVGYNEPKGA